MHTRGLTKRHSMCGSTVSKNCHFSGACFLNNFTTVDPHIKYRFVHHRVHAAGAPTTIYAMPSTVKLELHIVLYIKMSKNCHFSEACFLNNFTTVDPHIEFRFVMHRVHAAGAPTTIYAMPSTVKLELHIVLYLK